MPTYVRHGRNRLKQGLRNPVAENAEWRREGSVVRLEHPTRIDRARNLGYKAKQGIALYASYKAEVAGNPVRAREESLPDGGQPDHPWKKSSANCRRTCSVKYPNMEVLNSYWVGQDGKQKWFEVILVTGTTRPFRPTRTLPG